jgi:signal recognition particle subunit SRP68
VFAHRCHSIANSHFLLNKRRNALALQVRALELVSETIKTLQSTEGTGESGVRGITITVAQAEDLKARLEKEVTRFRALAEIEKASADRAHLAVTPLPLIQRLDIFPEAEIDLQNIVHIPPKLEAIPVKPIFFDVAWNYISYPGDGERVSTAKAKAAEDTEQSSTKKGGLFGLFGR